MTGTIMENPANNFAHSAEPDHGFENVLANHVRRRCMSIKDIQTEWNLTDGEARGVMYAQASRSTLRKIIKHQRGGWSLGIMLLHGVIGHSLPEHIERTRADERNKYERMDTGLRKMAADLPVLFGLDDTRRH